VESKLDIKAIEEEMNKLIELLYHEHNKISLHIIKKKKLKEGEDNALKVVKEEIQNKL
jgi:hypothetical protein